MLEHNESLTFNEIMFRLSYARIHASIQHVWLCIAGLSLLIQELEKYGLAFMEVSPLSFIQLVDAQVRLFQFHGVIHPIVNLEKDELFTESLPAPEYIKHRQLHPKTNVYGLGYFLYLLTGLKFAHQRLPPS